MSTEQVFDSRIKRFLKEQPNSTASATIRKIESYSPSFKNYYSLFDDFAFRLGLGFNAEEFVNSKTDKTIGYIPSLKYYPDNLLNEKPRVESLVSESSPMSLNHCYELLAKELLYRIMRIRNLDKIISNKKSTIRQ